MRALATARSIALLAPALCGVSVLPPAFTTALAASPTQLIASPGDTIAVYVIGRSEAMLGSLLERFSAETGTVVEATYGSDSRLAADLAGAEPPAMDLLLVQDIADAAAVADLLAPLPASLLQRVPTWARSADGRWVGLSARVRVVVYNPDRVAEGELPPDVAAFTRPEWGGGRIGWAPSNVSFQTMVNAMRIAWGEQALTDWLEGIIRNEPRVFGGNTALVRAIAAGEVDVGFVNHSYALRLAAASQEPFDARNHFLPGAGPQTLMVLAGGAVPRSSPNPQGAIDLLAFLLSDEGQHALSGSTFEYPVAVGAIPAASLTPLRGIDLPRMERFELGAISDLTAVRELLAELRLLP